MAGLSAHNRTLLVLLLSVVASAVLCAMMDRPARPPRPEDSGALPTIHPANAYLQEGEAVRISAHEGEALWIATDNRINHATRHGSSSALTARADARAVARALATPTAIQWRHPRAGLPAAQVVRAAEGRGPYAMRTFLFTRHALPVVSISTDPDGLLGAAEGIAVPGEGILHLPAATLRTYANDPKWWKYPGNYHGRGKAWERKARVQLIGTDGEELLQADAGLRINGQMTRGFPQHAFRRLFAEPLPTGPFADGDGAGSRALVLRAAGNDQVKAMLRDAYQHALCDDLPFGTSKSLTCVAYLNGAYQGVHHLRQRMDARELARRHGIARKRITLIEDKNALVSGDSADLKRFARLMSRTERWDAKDPAWLDTLEARMDVHGFLTYMASQMILGNMDWPRQNVKYWRWNGRPELGTVRDGRWRFVMGDSDLGFGANAPATTDLFVKVRAAGTILSRLYLAMMRNDVLRERFVNIGQALIEGPFATDRCIAVLDSVAAAMRPEMERHTDRWRKPATVAQWEQEVEAIRAFARARMPEARRQLNDMTAP